MTHRAVTRAEYDRFLPVVRGIAAHLAARVPRHIAQADLEGYGWMGLLEARGRIHPSAPDAEILAFVRPRIQGAMLDYLRTFDPLPRDLRALARRVARTHHRLACTLGRTPSETETAQALGMAEDAYRTACRRIAEDEAIRPQPLADQAVDTRAVPADEAILHREKRAGVFWAIGRLRPRLRRVVLLHHHGHTLRAIGTMLGVTESRVSQLHAEAMRHLRTLCGKPP